MHTVNGRPAYYYRNAQIVIAGTIISTKQMVKSLSTIRRQQKLSEDWRAEKGFGVMVSLDYIIVNVESEKGTE
jgi:hypothetical protein